MKHDDLIHTPASFLLIRGLLLNPETDVWVRPRNNKIVRQSNLLVADEEEWVSEQWGQNSALLVPSYYNDDTNVEVCRWNIAP